MKNPIQQLLTVCAVLAAICFISASVAFAAELRDPTDPSKVLTKETCTAGQQHLVMPPRNNEEYIARAARMLGCRQVLRQWLDAKKSEQEA